MFSLTLSLCLMGMPAISESEAGFPMPDSPPRISPPMGWNSWYRYSEAVSDTAIRETAKAMYDHGLVACGYKYVLIDDCWQGERGGPLNAIQPNERFPDMKALCDYVHSLGMKIGIYSTPWMGTYAGFIGGSDNFGEEKSRYIPLEKRPQKTQVFGRYPGLHRAKVDRTGKNWLFDNDAKQWAEWGFDYVKVDWKPNDIPTLKRIRESLDSSGRFFVLSVSNAAPLKDAKEYGKYAQLWRTTGDIHDSWGSIDNIGFVQSQKWISFQQPGAYNDFDMLQVGNIGTPNQQNIKSRPSRLTYEEQRTQLTLWSMLSAPLLLSCDMQVMSDSTLALLKNTDMIRIDQDALSFSPKLEKFSDNKSVEFMVKPMTDSQFAIAFYNRTQNVQKVKINFMKFSPWEQMTKSYAFRDVWAQKDVATSDITASKKSQTEFEVEIPVHGSLLYLATPVK